VRAVLKRHISELRTLGDPFDFTPLFTILRAARHPQEDRRMQTAEMAASLMDNAEFFDELGKLEALPEEYASEFPQLTPPVVPGVKRQPGPIARAPRPAAAVRGNGPQFIMPPEPNPLPPIVALARPAAMHPAVAVVGFALMMIVGASAAVLVFHDRVEQIVVQWKAAGR
jgi:hypothetical protein